MQPSDQVQVNDSTDARHGTAGLVIKSAIAADGTRNLTVRMDSDGASVVYGEAELKLLGR